MKRPKTGGQAAVIVKGALYGLVVSLAVIAAGCLLAAACIHLGKLPERWTPCCAWCVCALGSAAGCAAAQARTGKARLIVSLSCATALLLVMAAVRALLAAAGTAQRQSAAIVYAAAAAAALMKAGRAKRRR